MNSERHLDLGVESHVFFQLREKELLERIEKLEDALKLANDVNRELMDRFRSQGLSYSNPCAFSHLPDTSASGAIVTPAPAQATANPLGNF